MLQYTMMQLLEYSFETCIGSNMTKNKFESLLEKSRVYHVREDTPKEA